MAEVLSSVGFRTSVLEGGYMTYRADVVGLLPPSCMCFWRPASFWFASVLARMVCCWATTTSVEGYKGKLRNCQPVLKGTRV